MYDASSLYVDAFLSDFATGYREPEYYADRIMPFTRVGAKSGLYRVFDRSDRLLFKTRREPGTVANEIVGRKWTSDSYKTVQHSLQTFVTDEERRELASQGGLNQQAFGGTIDIDPEEDATELIVGALQRGHEKKVADMTRNTANYPVGNTVTLAGASQLDDYTGGTSSTSDPVSVILAAVRKIEGTIGRTPNRMLLPRQGASFLEQHPRVIARFTNFSLLDPDAWKLLSTFDGEIIQVGVGDDFYNSADNIDAAEVMTSFWGKDIWIGYVDQTEGNKVLTFGKTFVYPQLNGEEKPIDRWREEARKSDLFRQTWEYEPKIVTSGAGYLIKNAFSTGAW